MVSDYDYNLFVMSIISDWSPAATQWMWATCVSWSLSCTCLGNEEHTPREKSSSSVLNDSQRGTCCLLFLIGLYIFTDSCVTSGPITLCLHIDKFRETPNITHSLSNNNSSCILAIIYHFQWHFFSGFGQTKKRFGETITMLSDKG